MIQSKYGISIDQTNHITKGILKEYFDKDEKVEYESSQFLLDSKFEYELYMALPMTTEELEQDKKKYKGKYNKYTGASNILWYGVEKI